MSEANDNIESVEVVLNGEMDVTEIHLLDISSTCEVEVSDHVDSEASLSASDPNMSTEDQQMLRDEIKEEAIEDADNSQDISQQGKRLLLKDWLIQKLDGEEMPDILSWYNKSERLFRIKWLHKATDSWEMMADGVLFKEWCIHTGKYDPSNENPRKWKANFRCALNSLPDVIIVPTLCVRKGKDAYRVFKILPEKIPEKVREKQESSRKRRREKRETLLKAYAKNQADLGNVERAEAITKQMAVNPSNIKIHLKRAGPDNYGRVAKSSSTGSSGGTKVPLNGMDALCTAAAMMADPSKDGQTAEPAEKSAHVEVVTLSATPVTGGDIVTYYRPVGPVQLVNREKTKSATGATQLVTSSVKPVATVAKAFPLIPGPAVAGLPIFRPAITPVKLSTSAIATTSAGNMLLSVRLAGQTASAGGPPAANIVQTVSRMPFPQLAGLAPGVCLQPFSPTTSLTATGPQPTYLIPKTFIQQQIAASAGNQPARVFTVKPMKLADTHTEVAIQPNTQPSTAKFADIQPALSPAPRAFCDADYANLKAGITKLIDSESNNLPFELCKNSELIRAIRMYDSDKPCIEISVSIGHDYTYIVVVHNRSLAASHELLKRQGKTIKTAAAFKQFLEKLNEHVTCIGNPEEMAHRQYTDYSSFISAYQEPDFGAKNPVLRYYSTIRSNGCQLLIKSPGNVSTLLEDAAKECYRCDECSRMRTQVLSLRGLFSLLDGSKVPDTIPARKKRLKLLKEYTSKEVLANRVDILETQIKRYQQLLPTVELRAIAPVTSVDESHSTPPNVHVDAGVSHPVGPSGDADTAEYVSTRDTEDCSPAGDGDVQNVIRVTLAHPDGADTTEMSNRLSGDAVYHIVDASSSHGSDIMLVTDDDNMPTTEHLLEELSNSALANT